MSHPKHVASVAELYDQLAANGPYGTLAPSNRGGRKSRYVSEVFDACLLPLLAEHGHRHQVLLDYGCGTGIFAVQAARHVGKVIGLDVSEAMIEWGRRLDGGQLNIEWIVGDGALIPAQDASFDWVVARESLCYVPFAELPGVLAEIARTLRPDGRFLWLEQISDNPVFQTNPAAPLLEKRSASVLMAMAEKAGLTLESARCVRQPRFPWIYAVWAGLVPLAMLPRLARWEVAFHSRFGSVRASRWKDGLFVFRKAR